MKFPNISIRRETHVGSGTETPVEAVPGFAMVPWEVGIDPRLQHVDVRIYCILAACRRGLTVKIGTRLIARYARTSQRRAIAGLARLVSADYLKVDHGKNGARATYTLTSAWFSADRASTPVDSLPDRVDELREELASIKCPKCSKSVKRLGKTGWCRECNSAIALEKAISKAQAEMGLDATPEQIAARIKNAKLAVRVRRILEKVA